MDILILIAFIAVATITAYFLFSYVSVDDSEYDNDEYSEYSMTGEQLLSFITGCTWLALNNKLYDEHKLCLLAIDPIHHTFCVVKSLDNIYFKICIDKQSRISIICTDKYKNLFIFSKYLYMKDIWDFKDDNYFKYIMDLYRQMQYTEALIEFLR